MAVDPVCKMNVDEKKAVATSVYKGKKYYFCAIGCKKAFDKDPEAYLSDKEPEAEGECGTGWEAR
jgi:YHS domain-containing protein